MNVTPSITDYRAGAAAESKLSLAEAPLLEARLALDAATRRDAFRLRHLCYLSSGYIEERENGEFSDPYDAPATNYTIVIYRLGQAVASVRVCAAVPESDDPAGRQLPLAAVFPEEFAALTASGERAIELNRLVRHPEHAQNQRLVFVLFRMADFIIRQQDPDFVASCVRTNHAGFYRRLRFEHVAGPRQYTGLNFSTNFLACRRASYDAVRRNVPMLRIEPEAWLRYEGLLRGESVSVMEPGCGSEI